MFGGQRPGGRAHGFGKVGDDAGRPSVSVLASVPGGAGEIADLAGIDHGHRQAGAGQRGRDGGLVAPGGFEDDERGVQRLQPGDELDRARPRRG